MNALMEMLLAKVLVDCSLFEADHSNWLCKLYLYSFLYDLDSSFKGIIYTVTM